MSPLARRSRRGAATVELAVLMIVLVPTILYTLFLEDLLVYKLDQQETVVSTPWDFHNQDYREKKRSEINDMVARASMQTYWDHTSAWNTYDDPNYDAKSVDHHQALTAHQCWLAQGGEEITCNVRGTVGMVVDPTFNFMNRGGFANCTAVLGVQNYFLPQDLFGKMFSAVSIGGEKLRKTKFEDRDIHNNAKQDPYVFPRTNFGVLADPWALNRMENRYNPLAHPVNIGARFSNWVNIPYGLRRGMLNDAKQFAQDAIDKDILASSVKSEPLGDILDTPPVAWKAAYDRKFGKHTASAYSDNRQANTYGKRTGDYLGMSQDTW